jgi:cytochrome c oxidase cbb3-type subunit 3
MYTNHSFGKKLITGAVTLFVAGSAFAQDTAAAGAEKAAEPGNNLLAILLIVSAVILAFVTWGMGQALIAVSRLAWEKQKEAQKVATVILLVAFSLLSTTSFGQATAATPAATANYGGLSANTFYAFAIVIGIEILAILYLAFMIKKVFSDLRPKKVLAPGEKGALGTWWDNLDKKVFTKATPIEKEADVLLDHDYDGIHELDNALPPWWKYGFYITIVVAFVYIILFHITGDGKNPAQEYMAEMEKAKIEKEVFEANNKDRIDEKNVPMADNAGIAKGKEIYESKCWPCHGKLGEGGAGPNLTDDYWIHKGSLNDIYNSLKVGYQDKGMQSWAKDYSPKELSFIASYVKTLKGTNPPNGKAPQGDLFTEAAAAPAAATDSTKAGTTTDSTAVKPTVDAKK